MNKGDFSVFMPKLWALRNLFHRNFISMCWGQAVIWYSHLFTSTSSWCLIDFDRFYIPSKKSTSTPNPCETKHLNTQTTLLDMFSVTKNQQKGRRRGKRSERGRSQACGCNDMHLYKAFGVEDWSGDGFDLWGVKKNGQYRGILGCYR